MGKIVKYLGLLGVLLIVLVITLRFVLGNPSSALYKVFLSESDKYYIHKLIGLTPKEFADRYSTSVLESFENMEVINLIDNGNSIKRNFILVKNEQEEQFMKAYPLELLNDKAFDDIIWGDHMSYLINVSIFNKYIKEAKISGDEIMEKYCFFLSNPENSNSYRVLKSTSEIDSLITDIPLGNGDAIIGSGYNILNYQELIFDRSTEVMYCWYLNKGVVRFHFIIEEDEVVDVSSSILGFLGNEFPTCC